MYAVRWDEERIIQGLAAVMCLAMMGMAVMPAVGVTDLAAYLASQGNSVGAAGSVLAGAGLIRISPEVAMFLVETGLISSSTGVGIAIGGILAGVGLAL